MTRSNINTCFDKEQLASYLNEELNEVEEAKILEHIGSCSDCQKRLEESAAQTAVWNDLRENIPAQWEEEADAPSVDHRWERILEILGPTDDPNMLGRLGNYEVCGVVGHGSTGVVLKAFESRLNRFVAIKVLSPTFNGKGAARHRFEREARAVAAVQHENIVPIFAVDEYRGWPYIVMQYIPGLSLLQRMDQQGPLDTCEVSRIGIQVARGLAAAHRQGVIHRDVKPANVMLESTVDRAMVTDFGLARMADDVSMTQSGVIAGTPQYMSPEQAKGETLDARSDLFGLGSLLYAACTARPPFRAETIFGVIHRVCNHEPRPIRDINPRIDKWLCDFIARLMSKDRNDRFQSAEEVAELLATELAYLQSPETAPQPLRSWQQTQLAVEPKPEKAEVGSKSWWPLALFGSIAAIGVLMFMFPVGESLKNAMGWGDSEPGDGSHRVASKTNPPKNNSLPFFSQVQNFEVSDTPTITWKPMEDDWNSGALATFDQKWEQAFEVSESSTFSLTADLGDVVIRPNETDDRVVVTMMRRVEAASQGEAEKLLERHSLKITQDDSQFKLDGSLAQAFTQSDKAQRLSRVLFRVSIPRTFVANVDVAKGNVTIGELGSDTTIKTDLGRIKTERIGGNLTVEGRGGCIDLRAGCTGKATVLCENADVYIANVDQDDSKVKISGGSAWIGECSGKLYAQSSGGNIKVVNCGAAVGAFALDGNVEVYMDQSPVANCSFGATLGTLKIRIDESIAAKVEFASTDDFGEFGKERVSTETNEGWVTRSFNEGQFVIRGKCDSGEVDFQVVSSAESKDFTNLDVHGLGGSGLGGSGSGLSSETNEILQAALKKMSPEPKAGHFTTFKVDNEVMDGYTLYLPASFDENRKTYPILVSLGGAWTVGGKIESVNLWGLNRLIRDESDLSNERNKLILDSFIVVAPHIQKGSYSKHPQTVEAIVKTVAKDFRGDLDRIYLTGLSRGGHGTWGLASKLPELFAAIVPIAGNTNDIEADDFSKLTEPAIWIAHNTGDGSFSSSQKAVSEIEKLTGQTFFTTEKSDVSETAFLDQRFVFVTPERNHHDAWTETYCRPELYQWLLKQSKSK